MRNNRAGQSWRLWRGSLEDHLRIFRPNATNYVVRGVGIFIIGAIMYPPSRYLGAAMVGIGYVIAEFLSYHVALAIYHRRLRRKYPRRHLP